MMSSSKFVRRGQKEQSVGRIRLHVLSRVGTSGEANQLPAPNSPGLMLAVLNASPGRGAV